MLKIAHLQLKMYNYFNFVECNCLKRQELKQRIANTDVVLSSQEVRATACTSSNDPSLNRETIVLMRTSYTEYEADALAHGADEGRGDRRNVQGELHPSDEP